MSDFDVANSNIDDVKKHVSDNPDQLGSVLAVEKARGDAARSTLVSYLEEKASAAPEPAASPAVDVGPDAPVDEELQTSKILGEEYTVDPLKGYRVKAGRTA